MHCEDEKLTILLKIVLAVNNKKFVFNILKQKGKLIMKKTAIRLLALMLALVMCFSLGACGDKNNGNNDDAYGDLGGDINFDGTVSGEGNVNADGSFGG